MSLCKNAAGWGSRVDGYLFLGRVFHLDGLAHLASDVVQSQTGGQQQKQR